MKEKKLIKKLFRKSWLALKLKVFFTISKNLKKIAGHTVNYGLALSNLGLFGLGQRSLDFFKLRKLLP